MFLRAHVKGGRIEAARQVESDRVVRVDIVRGDDRKTLWIRLWSSAANIIATDADGVILDAFYRRPKRGEISGGRYAGVRPIEPRGPLRPRGPSAQAPIASTRYAT